MMCKELSISKEIILHRLSTDGTTWDAAIAETELAIKQLKNTLCYFREQKAANAPFPIRDDASTQI